MHAVLDDSMTLAMVQKLFNDLFPFLKIEFFEREIKNNGTVNTRKRINNTQKTLSEYRHASSLKSNKIILNPETSVSQLEKEFNSEYKLQTQVFRKSGNIWLETTVTDSWSLEEQNNQGQLITDQLAK